MTREAMEDVGLQWNPKKCDVLNVRSGVPEGFKSGEMSIDSLKGDATYRSLGACTGTETSRRKAGSAAYY